MININEPVLRMAIETFGAQAQKTKAIEELGELIVALTNPKKTEAQIVDEIADVLIMSTQLALIYPGVQDRIEFKLKRLEERVTADP